MLTENKVNGKEKNDGNKRNFENAIGGKNAKLSKFLKEYHDPIRRDVTKIKEYFDTKEIPLNCFNGKFTHSEREKYFSEISKSDLNNHLIFFDPDNGLEVKKSNHKHVKFLELLKFYEEMDKKSIIVVIQFKSREKWEEKTLPNKFAKFKDVFPDDLPNVNCIYGQGIAFFIIAKTNERSIDVQDALKKYKSCYPYLNIYITE
jgi:hypothetical protein